MAKTTVKDQVTKSRKRRNVKNAVQSKSTGNDSTSLGRSLDESIIDNCNVSARNNEEYQKVLERIEGQANTYRLMMAAAKRDGEGLKALKQNQINEGLATDVELTKADNAKANLTLDHKVQSLEAYQRELDGDLQSQNIRADIAGVNAEALGIQLEGKEQLLPYLREEQKIIVERAKVKVEASRAELSHTIAMLRGNV